MAATASVCSYFFILFPSSIFHPLNRLIRFLNQLWLQLISAFSRWQLQEVQPLSPIQSSAVCSYLPEELWERIIKCLNDDPCTFKSLSVVSKQFLSITNRLRSSVTIKFETIPFLFRLFQRFPNLTSLSLILYCKTYDFDVILSTISKLCPRLSDIKSLSLSNPNTDIPAKGLQALSKKMTNLTSLTCDGMFSYYENDLFFIAQYFPLLEELQLIYPQFPGYDFSDFNTLLYGNQMLELPKLRKINLYGNNISRQTIDYLCKNCELLQEVLC